MDDSQIATKDDVQAVKDQLADLDGKVAVLSARIDDFNQKFDQLDSKYIKSDWSSLEQVLISSSGGFFDDVAKTPFIIAQFSNITDQIASLQTQLSALASKAGGS